MERILPHDVDKAAFRKLLEDAGYPSLRKFSEAIGVPSSSICNNFSGTYGLSVERTIKFANALHVPMVEIVRIFYPSLYESNRPYMDSHTSY